MTLSGGVEGRGLVTGALPGTNGRGLAFGLEAGVKGSQYNNIKIYIVHTRCVIR